MKQTRLLLVVMAITIAFFASCKKSSELTNAIPAGAITVIHIDTKSLLQKADYKPMDNKVIKEALEEQKKDMGERQTQLMAKIEELLKNPNSSGLDVIEDCFIYMDSISMGIVWGVNDQKKLKDLLTKTFEMPEQLLIEEDGVTMIDMSRQAKLGWTKDKFLIVSYSGMAYASRYSSAEMPDLKDILKKQLKQTASESINSNKAFTDFMSQRKDVSIFYAYDNAMSIWDSTLGMMIGRGYYDEMTTGLMNIISKAKEDIKGISTGAFLSFEKGEIVFENKMYYASADVEKRFKELSDNMTGEIKADQLKYISEKPIFLVSANLKGEGVYNYIDQLGVVEMIDKNAGDELKEKGIDLKSIISNVDGDITIAINSVKSYMKKSKYSDYEYQTTDPEFTVLIDTKDATPTWNLIKEKIAENKAQMEEYGAADSTLVEVSPTMYSVEMDDNMTGYFGINNNTFFFTNKEEVYKALAASGSDNSWAAQAKGKKAFLYGNLSPLAAPLIAETGSNDATLTGFINKGFSLMGDYSYTVENNMGGKGKMEITDKSANSLAVIVKYIDGIITYAIQENM